MEKIIVFWDTNVVQLQENLLLEMDRVDSTLSLTDKFSHPSHCDGTHPSLVTMLREP